MNQSFEVRTDMNSQMVFKNIFHQLTSILSSFWINVWKRYTNCIIRFTALLQFVDFAAQCACVRVVFDFNDKYFFCLQTDVERFSNKCEKINKQQNKASKYDEENAKKRKICETCNRFAVLTILFLSGIVHVLIKCQNNKWKHTMHPNYLDSLWKNDSKKQSILKCT